MVGFWIFLIVLTICMTILGSVIIYERYENQTAFSWSDMDRIEKNMRKLLVDYEKILKEEGDN